MIEPAGTVAGGRPLVVPVHGSERTSALNSAYGYSLAAQGIAVFVYDKQGHEELGKVRSELAQRSWSQRIRGEYSGEILRMTDDELRRLGRARFDNLGIGSTDGSPDPTAEHRSSSKKFDRMKQDGPDVRDILSILSILSTRLVTAA